MRLPANKPCVCHSGRKAKGCCGPILGGALAPTPVALMRSRYAAYVLGNVGHIIKTTHPEGPHYQENTPAWTKEIRAFCERFSFDGLDVKQSGEEGVSGWVEFTAHLSHGQQDHSFSERSVFFQESGSWLYHSGTANKDGTP